MLGIAERLVSLRDAPKKKRKNVVILKKQGGWVYPNPTSIFTVFNMGDPPTINVPEVLKCKINHFFSSHKHDIPKQRGGGVPELGKIPTFSRFF